MPNVYDSVDHLYNPFRGRPAKLEYLPTQRSRKWRSASVSVLRYCPEHHEVEAGKLAKQEGWYQVQWVEGN